MSTKWIMQRWEQWDYHTDGKWVTKGTTDDPEVASAYGDRDPEGKEAGRYRVIERVSDPTLEDTKGDGRVLNVDGPGTVPKPDYRAVDGFTALHEASALREALEEIERSGRISAEHPNEDFTSGERHSDCIWIARRALEDTKGEG